MQVRPLPIPPWERPNWLALNRGQRLYAIRQHNIARRNRGLPDAFPPFDIDEEELVDVPSPEIHGNLPLLDISDDDMIIDSDRGEKRKSTKDTDEPPDKLKAIEYDKPEPLIATKHKLPSESIIPSKKDKQDAGPSHRQTEAEKTVETTTANIPLTTMSTAEPASAPTLTPAAKATTGAATASKGTKRKNDNPVETDGTAEGNVDGQASVEVFAIPRNHFLNESQTMVVGKSLRFYSRGYASTIISRAVTGPPAYTQYFLTTSLAEIPVHRLELYMSPAEYNVLPDGAFCKHVSVMITQRNPLVSFDTNASTSTTATINQVKQCIKAYGLNLTGMGQNVNIPTPSGTEKMLPTSVLKPIYNANDSGTTYKGLQATLYGSNSAIATNPPAALLSNPIILQNYWAWIQKSQTSSQGWPDTTQYFDQWDGADRVNRNVCTYEYTPFIAPIKTPLSAVHVVLPHINAKTMRSSTVEESREFYTLTSNSITDQNIARSNATTDQSVGVTFPYQNSNLEKSHFLRHGYRTKHEVKTQPSLHIGIMAIPSFDSSQAFEVNATFDDVRVEWVVQTKMYIGFNQRIKYAFDNINSLPIHSALREDNGTIAGGTIQGLTFDGLIQTNDCFSDT